MGSGNPNPKGGHAKIMHLTQGPETWVATIEGENPCPFKEGDDVYVALDPSAGDEGSGGNENPQ